MVGSAGVPSFGRGRSGKVKTSDAGKMLRDLFKTCADLADRLERHSIRKFFKSLMGRDTEDDLDGLIRSLYKGSKSDFHDDVNESTFLKLVQELEHVHQRLKEALSEAKGEREIEVNFVELTKISQNVILGATGIVTGSPSDKSSSINSVENERSTSSK